MKISKYYLLFLLFFVFIDECVNNFLLTSSAKTLEKDIGIIYLFMGLQLIFSPIQSGFSDFYLRKKSLMFSLLFAFISVILFYYYFEKSLLAVFLAFILKAIFSNTIPISWAAIADITKHKNIRFALALSIFALAVGSWGSLYLVPHISIPVFFKIVIIGTLLASIFICMFRDSKDLKEYKKNLVIYPSPSFIFLIKEELFSLWKLIKKSQNIYILFSFIFSEISFYQILFRVEIARAVSSLLYFPAAIGIGYSSGTLLLKFLKGDDKKVALFGILIASISIILLLMLGSINEEKEFWYLLFFGGYSFGFALFTPAIFSLIFPRSQPHQSGKIYGLVDSADSLSGIITFLIIFHSLQISAYHVFAISTIMIFCSLVFLLLFFYKKNQIKEVVKE